MVGRLLGGRYRVLDKVGEGGMAVVYKAQCTLLNRIVAVKVLKSQYGNDADFVERFKREAQAAASLSHPNIVNIYDVGNDNGSHYIVMEYVRGETLRDIIKQRAPLTIRIHPGLCLSDPACSRPRALEFDGPQGYQASQHHCDR